MKKAGWTTTAAIAAVAVVGGGTAYALNQSEPTPRETPAAVSTATPEPTVEASSEPTPDATPSAAPVTVTPPTTDPEAPENDFLTMAGTLVRGYGYEITDEELMTAGRYVCDQFAAGAEFGTVDALEGAGDGVNGDFEMVARDYLCQS